MTDQDDKTKQIPEGEYNYERDHGDSIQTMMAKTRERKKKVQEEPKEEVKEEIKVEEKPKEEKPDVDPERIAEEAATKATAQARVEFKKELEEIEKSKQSEEEKSKQADELKAVWEKEDRLPTDWREAANEIARVTELKIRKELAEQESSRIEKQAAENTRLRKEQEDRDNATQSVKNKIAGELEELYAGGYLKKDDTVTHDALFNKAVEVNNERLSRKEPPIDSIAKIYFMHYKGNVEKQPAGADAPISGGRSAGAPSTDGKLDYIRDIRNKSFRDIAMEQLKKRK